MLVRENHEKRLLAKPVVLSCQFRADRDLVLRCQETAAPDRKTWRGQPLGTLSNLWPWSDMKDLVKNEAQQFVGYMKQQNYDPIGDYTAMELWGPYMQKVDWSKARNPNARWSDGNNYPEAFLHGGNDVNFDLGVVFYIKGNFLGRYGRMVEGIEQEVLLV